MNCRSGGSGPLRAPDPPDYSECKSQSKPRNARADPAARVAEGAAARVDHAVSNGAVDDPLIVDVEEVEIDADPSIVRADRERLLDTQIEVVDRIGAPRAARL